MDWGWRAARYLAENKKSYVRKKSLNINKFLFPVDVNKIEPIDPAFIKQDWDNLKNIMWNYVGLIRNTKRLNKALLNLKTLYETFIDSYKLNLLEKNVIELKNAIETALIITKNALQNKRSKGSHFLQN